MNQVNFSLKTTNGKEVIERKCGILRCVMFVHQQRLLIPFLSDIMSYHTEQSLSPSAHNVSHSHRKYTTPSVTKHAQLQRSHPSQSLHHKQRKINHPIKTKTTHSSTYLSYGTKSKFTTQTLSASHLC